MRRHARWPVGLFELIFIVWAACDIGWSEFEGATAQAQVSSGWFEHRDPFGFSVQIPAGWQVRTDARSGRVELAGPEGELMILWPVYIPGYLDAGMASATLSKLMMGLAPDIQWESPQFAHASAVRAQGRSANRVAVSIFTWVTAPQGNAGYVYLIAAPEARYRQMEGIFEKILQSFRALGAPSQSEASFLNYTRWQDPRENAFSLEVPNQWTINGGLFRYASVDTRPAWEMLSPDGQIRISGGDAEIPTFVLPNEMLQFAGFTEGSWYSPGYGVNMMVRRYQTGKEFARDYVMWKGARGCTDVVFTEVRDRPDLTQGINAIYAQFGQLGTYLNMDGGEVAFTCQQGGQTLHGYYLALTQSAQSAYGAGIWTVPYLCGYLATSGKLELAQSVFKRVLESIQLNPQWVAMQQGISADTSRIVTETNTVISNIINDTYWARQPIMDEISRRRSNAILGVEDVVDPLTGRETKVESGSNYYWIDHRGTIVGTDTDSRPNLDFRELIRLP